MAIGIVVLYCQHHSDTLQLVFPIFQQLSCSTVDINSIDKFYICYIILQHVVLYHKLV